VRPEPRLVAVILGVALLTGCARITAARPPRDAKGTAERVADLAASPEQGRLWREAAAEDKAKGLEQVPTVEQPVQPRARATVATRPAASQSVEFPPSLVAGLRILAASGLGDGTFSGPALVRRSEKERLELDLGQGRTLTLIARVRGGPMRAQPGQRAQVFYSVNFDPLDRREIVALRIETGDGIASILETAKRPVRVQVPLFELAATQVGAPEGGTMRVEVRIGGRAQVLRQGQIVEFSESGLTVGLVASLARETSDGNPYAIRLVIWATK